MKLILMLLLIISSSCQTFPKVKVLERCVISVDSNKCRCHSYQISEKNIGRVSESIDRSIEYCDKLIGFRAESWTELRVWFEEIYLWLDDMENLKDGR